MGLRSPTCYSLSETLEICYLWRGLLRPGCLCGVCVGGGGGCVRVLCVFVSVCVYMYVYVRVCVCACVCVCVVS